MGPQPDVGAYLNGYHGDNAATFAAGSISPQAQALLDDVRAKLDEARDALEDDAEEAANVTVSLV